jgi:proteasome accessory factor B
VPDPLERLTNLTALLLEARQPLSLNEIADALAGQYPDGDSARRGAFERDKAMLRSVGVPITTTVLSGDRAGQTGYLVDRRRYELRLDLASDERRALQVAVAAVHTGVDWADDALLKLGVDDDEAAGAAPVATAAVPSLPALPVLLEANTNRSTVSFHYHGRRRRLDPYGLLTRDGFWYVIGHEHERGEQRTYRVDRIEGHVEAGSPDAFAVPDDFDVRTAMARDPKAIGAEPAQALVLVDGVRAAKVERETGADAVTERRPDGAIVVRVPAGNPDAFRSWVLGLGEHAVVLGPPEVRAAMVTWLSAMADAEP